jgi:hypothetical protein
LNIYAGGFGTAATVSDAAFQGLQASFNGASSAIVVDGTSNASSSPGSGAWGQDAEIIGANSGNLVGAVCEVGFVNAALSTGDQSALNSNQHGTSGYNF